MFQFDSILADQWLMTLLTKDIIQKYDGELIVTRLLALPAPHFAALRGPAFPGTDKKFWTPDVQPIHDPSDPKYSRQLYWRFLDKLDGCVKEEALQKLEDVLRDDSPDSRINTRHPLIE